MDLHTLFLDFDKNSFLKNFSKEFDSKFFLSSNIEFSLKQAIKKYYSELFKIDLDIIIFSFNAEETTLKKYLLMVF